MKMLEQSGKAILNQLISKERYGWPPACTMILYQPERPAESQNTSGTDKENHD